MRHFLLFPALLLFGQLNARSAAPQKIYTVAQLPELLNKAKTDSTLYEERAAAKLFHKIINAYRLENNKDTLAWNDTLWLASRNHCVWMLNHKELTHHQKLNTELFSGDGPGDRYDYAVNGKGRHSWSGENALYNWSAGYSTMKSRIKMMAEHSFNQWKESPGHNRNMLSEGSAVHGTAFLVNPENDQVWAVDLFARRPSGEIFVSKKKPVETTNEFSGIVTLVGNKTTTATAQKVNTTKAKTQLLGLLYAKDQSLKDDVMATAAISHAKYLSSSKVQEHTQVKGKPYFTAVTPQQRVKAAAEGLDKFRYRKVKVGERIAVIEVSNDEFDAKKVAALIQEIWKADDAGADAAAKFGIGLEVKRVKDKIRICAVKVEG